MENLSYNQTRKQINTTCYYCDITFQKPLSEYMRNIRKGMKQFCSLSCCAKYTNGINWDENMIPFRYMIKQCINHTSSRRSKLTQMTLTCKNLMEKWEEQEGKCAYTGIKMELRTRSKESEFRLRQASVDRIDSSKGYTRDNTEIVCLGINYMKHVCSKEDTIKFLDLIKSA